MRPLYYLSALGLSCALLGAPSVPAQTYSVKDLGLPPQAVYSQAGAINQSGQVLVYSSALPLLFFVTANTSVYSNGNFTTLDFIGKGIAGDNRNNAPASQAELRVAGFNGISAVLYQNNLEQTLGSLPGSSDSFAYGVNSSGQVAGTALDLQQAFLYSKGNMINLGTLPGYTGAQAWALNDTGDVTGVAVTPSGSYGHGFLYHDSTMTDIGVLPGASISWGLAINNSLQIAGYSYSTNETFVHAFLWSNGQMKDLGVLPKGSQSMAEGMNSQGQVVGTGDVGNPGSAANLQNHGFLYTNGKMYDLNSLIPPNSGWTIQDAEGINDNGQISASGYTQAAGLSAPHALLLTPVAATCCSGPAVKLTVKDGQGFFWDGGGSEFGRTALQVYQDNVSLAQNWTWQPVAGGFTICTLSTVCLSDNGAQVELGKKADVFLITKESAVLDTNTGRYVQNATKPANGAYLSTGPLESAWNFSLTLH